MSIVMEAATEDAARLSGLMIGQIVFKGAGSRGAGSADRALEEAYADARKRFSGVPQLSDDPIIKGIRSIFSRAGTDPTKDRPSGEALIRRVLGGSGIYRINAIVDTNNAVSVMSGCPCGIYDLSKIRGERIEVRIGKEGQSYEGIGGRSINASGRIVTSDSEGMFGGPVADSGRTCIEEGATDLLMLIYYPAGAGMDGLERTISIAERMMAETVGAQAVERRIFTAEG